MEDTLTSRKPRTRDDLLFDGLINGILLFVLIVTLIPLVYVVMVSVTPMGEKSSLFLPPTQWSFSAYIELLKQPAMLRAGLNSVIITVGGVLVSMIVTVLTAYPLSRRDLPGRKIISGLILFTFLFNAGLIPLYLVIRDLGLINSYWALLLNGAVSVYNLFVMKNFFENLPDSLEEAARIDGASELQILWHIVMPLSKPILLTIGLFYAVTSWNNFFDPILFFSDREMMPLPVILRDILTGLNSADYAESTSNTTSHPEALKMAAVVLTTLPMLLIYPWIQKYFTRGTLTGGVKE
ncbi:carbohydrate ABC transporter permease [Deinococcus cellulosilyticus]|uniref:Putative ABC transporter permease protein YtcP n=1 Tax=Deinococcus cellulosilyticus (strain DSM 18568 / NBRC 106333 / KACC 11606 / 5516J-15) TaxID=1223518 RepID=A0A511N1R7_DEIC1|nr:carbohydrate ABC transporter permease [Deinococcus cellulosilyticus]GEM46306.1 putative ABC transporter permease protein YtcP [Deinococcus cellulosilyticus NBRC 106333 = KACC 11606]